MDIFVIRLSEMEMVVANKVYLWMIFSLLVLYRLDSRVESTADPDGSTKRGADALILIGRDPAKGRG